MNESGKTTVLAALHRINPIDGHGFDVQRDYPRWLLTKDRRAGSIDETKPIEAIFELDGDDAAAVEETLGADVLTSTTVTVTRRYGGSESVWSFTRDTRKAVDHLLDRANIRKKTVDRFKAVSDLDGIEDVCAELLDDTSDNQAETTAEEVVRIREALALVPGGTTVQAILTLLEPRLPRFFYFADYSVLQGRIDVAELESGAEETGSSSGQTARALLALAGTTPAALSRDDYEDRKAELEAVGHDLTSQVFEYWKQNPNLRVQFDIDRQIAAVNVHQHQVVRTYLDIRVEDSRHAFTNTSTSDPLVSNGSSPFLQRSRSSNPDMTPLSCCWTSPA